MPDNDHWTVTWESDPFPSPEENAIVLVRLNEGSPIMVILTTRPFDQGKSFRWYYGNVITTVEGRERFKSWAWIRKPYKTEA